MARQRAGRVDARVIRVLRRVSVPLLRVSLGLVFVWFGLLKVFQVSPVSELVASTVYWFDASWVVPALGVVEVFVGTCLLLGRLMRLTLL
ncbi:MAG TPA: DoxX family membrane protein, partial [Actinomycetota bacterium]